jgi:hypothetical protein
MVRRFYSNVPSQGTREGRITFGEERIYKGKEWQPARTETSEDRAIQWIVIGPSRQQNALPRGARATIVWLTCTVSNWLNYKFYILGHGLLNFVIS